jgi:hypothetical protein
MGTTRTVWAVQVHVAAHEDVVVLGLGAFRDSVRNLVPPLLHQMRGRSGESDFQKDAIVCLVNL